MTTPRWLRWTLLALLVLGLAWGVGRALQARKAQQANAAAAAERMATPPVYELPAADALAVAPVTLVQAIEISGTVKARQSASVARSVRWRAAGVIPLLPTISRWPRWRSVSRSQLRLRP